MTVDLGKVGIWSRELRFNPDRGARAAAAAELEELGYSAIFIPDVGGDVLGAAAELLAATRRGALASGGRNIWVAARYRDPEYMDARPGDGGERARGPRGALRLQVPARARQRPRAARGVRP